MIPFADVVKQVQQGSGRSVILAPHPDDEVIGCHRVIRAGLIDAVVYFFEREGQRVKESQVAASQLGFCPFQWPAMPDDINCLFIPMAEEKHQHHLYVYHTAKAIPARQRIYYSVAMNVPHEVLDLDERAGKRNMLDRFYPSQQKLWENDERYYLFEAYSLSPFAPHPIMGEVRTLLTAAEVLRNLTPVDNLSESDRQRYREAAAEVALFKHKVNWNALVKELP